MDYDQEMCCEVDADAGKEISIREKLQLTEKALIETRSILLNIIEGITNQPRTDSDFRESECMQDSANQICGLTNDCLSLANRIHSLMF